MIDTDGDGQLSEIEKHAYAIQVIQSLSLEVDRVKLELSLLDSQFPVIEAMAAGQESIRLKVQADLPVSWAASRQLRFVNHHAPAISVYLVNCLVPADGEPVIAAQKRDYAQSEIQVTYSFKTSWSPIQHTVWWVSAGGIAILFGWAYRVRQKV